MQPSWTINTGKRFALRGFTLAELVVVIAILAILATVWFLALTWYRDDARVSSTKANVRSVYTAIAAESAVTGNSPRSYVKHDPDFALSWAVVIIEGASSNLVWGDWGEAGTNYSAGNPDFIKLRLDPERFRVSKSRFREYFHSAFATSASDVDLPVVWAADLRIIENGKERDFRYTQVTAILPSDIAYVAGDFPISGNESAAGLIRDAKNPSSTGALVDWAPTGAPAPCDSATLSGYSVPSLESGKSISITKAVWNGELTAKATCSFWKLSIAEESIACGSGYVPSGGESCVADVCWGNAPGSEIANAESNAVSQSVSSNWHYSEVPWVCTFACASGRTWDGSSCRASCDIPPTAIHEWLPYALGTLGTLVHGQSASRVGEHAFGISPSNGTLSADFTISCNDGTVSTSSASSAGTCPTEHQWNSSWTSPACDAAVTGTCGAAVKTYAYSSSSFGSDALCAFWNPVPGSVAFPSAGWTSNWKCSGLFGWPDSGTCSASRWSCAAAPAFANVWAATVGNPAAMATAWAYSATPGNCTYVCANGYLWTGCSVSGIVGNDATGRNWANGTYAESCKAYKNPTGSRAYEWATGDGTYWIDPDGTWSVAVFKVLCDMTTDGGGWTIIGSSLANADGDSTTKPFNATWATIKTAWVGTMTSANTNFHVSMDKYLAMANASNKVDYAWYAKSGKSTDPWQKTLQYSAHYLANDGYFTWNGTAEYSLNSLTAYNGTRLSAYDADNDATTSNCALAYGSFWWYTACHGAHYWSMTDERSTTCNPGGANSWTSHNRWGTAVCNGYSNNGPDAAGAYNTWYQLKVMIR